MKKYHFFTLLACATMIFMSFTQLELTTDATPIKMDVETLEFLQVDEILDTETIAKENGTFNLTVRAVQAGKVVTQTFEATGYSPEGDCVCVDCETWAPHGNAYKRKLVIGTKCWCLYCEIGPIHSPF